MQFNFVEFDIVAKPKPPPTASSNMTALVEISVTTSHLPYTSQYPPLPTIKPFSDNKSLPRNNTNSSYALSLKNMEKQRKENLAVQRKAVSMINREPVIRWTEKEVKMMNVIENLQYVIVGKFNNV
ncbi:hypothetical protein HAX54_028010 [Datura stramonium]|uniref:Uncharacterized protein n=1 Tax=Datura stramonium TaxID=4076 RepID=A0ABS8V5K8_DATST|nr:hypothetical protein [Datura stramonium]